MITTRHITIATKVARQGNVVKGKMSAIAVTKNGHIIAFANNRKLDGDHKNWSEHCEAALIRKLEKIKAFKRYKNISIFVFRISSNGISMARPCKNCQKLLSKYSINILYTTDDGQIKKLALKGK